MHLVSLHRAVFRFAPPFVRARLKDSIPFGVHRIPLYLPDGQAIVLDHLECSKILRRFAWKGIYGYEPDTIRLFHALAKRARGVLDIGAYFGLYALVAAKANAGASVHAFEPLPQNLELLRHFLDLNGCTGVAVHAFALARQAGQATLYIPQERMSALPATGSLKDRFRSGERFADLNAQKTFVRTVSLDAWVEERDLEHIDLVKIDTEETEYDVLVGAIGTLKRFRPDIVMEVTFSDPRVGDAVEVLRDLGYRFFHIDPAGLSPFDPRRPTQSSRSATSDDRVHCEILCVGREGSDLVRYS
jgi:FkbM family methyltransferase